MAQHRAVQKKGRFVNLCHAEMEVFAVMVGPLINVTVLMDMEGKTAVNVSLV